jgi:rare lipoprotein A
MNNKIYLLFFALLISFVGNSFAGNNPKQKDKPKEKTEKNQEPKEKGKSVPSPTKVDSVAIKINTVTAQIDSLDLLNSKFKLVKKNAHASYYHNKFNGRRTASGRKFNNNDYTAAHKKLPFGTKLKVTNESNGKFVIVEVTDRGPFSKAREIDLSRRAFMDIVSNKNSGVVIVTIEVLEPK